MLMLSTQGHKISSNINNVRAVFKVNKAHPIPKVLILKPMGGVEIKLTSQMLGGHLKDLIIKEPNLYLDQDNLQTHRDKVALYS